MSKILNDNGWKHLFGIIKGAFVSNTDVEEATLVDVYSKTETDTALAAKANKTAIKCFSITEDMFDLTTTDAPAVSPYNTSYGYTNITIHTDAGVEWIEGALYSFVLNTKVATSTYRNVRVRIGDGDYKPLMGDTAILAGNTYFVKGVVFIFIYKTTYQTGGALHRNTDANSDVYLRIYRSATNVDLPLAAASTGTSTAAWADPNSGSYKSAYGAVGNTATTRPTLNPSTGLVKIPVGKYTGTPTENDDLVNKAYADTKANKVTEATSNPSTGLLPNVFYNLGILGSDISFSLADGTPADEYMIQFSTGSTAPTVTWPEGVSWLGNATPTIKASKTYQVSIVNHLAVIGEFENEEPA